VTGYPYAVAATATHLLSSLSPRRRSVFTRLPCVGVVTDRGGRLAAKELRVNAIAPMRRGV